MAPRFRSVLAVMLVLLTTTYAAEVRGKKACVRGWEGRTVVLKQPLYSLVHNERSRFVPLMMQDGKVSGLTHAARTSRTSAIATRWR